VPYYDPDKSPVFVFALSTCAHCQAAKKLLGELGLHCGQVEVDALPEKKMKEALDEMSRHNPAQTFPTVIVGRRAIAGHLPDDIKAAAARLRAGKQRAGRR
jgi:glutaredoxin-like protein NrdH